MIQPLTPKSLVAISRVEQLCFLSPWSESQLAQVLSQPRYRAFGYFQQELVGFAVFSVVMDEAELLQIGVDPQIQRQGIARALLLHSFAALQQESIRRIMLEVRQSNLPARDLYSNMGLQIDGARKAYYPPLQQGGNREDAILMSYIFPE